MSDRFDSAEWAELAAAASRLGAAVAQFENARDNYWQIAADEEAVGVRR